MIYRKFQTFLMFGAAVCLPGALIFSGLGFFQAHGRDAPPFPPLARVESAAPVSDGNAISFEFRAEDESPFWILLQNRSAVSQEQTVLISRSPGFEDYRRLLVGSQQETQILRRLRELKPRYQAGEPVRHNLDLLIKVIAARDQAWPSVHEWYFNEN